MRPLVDLVVWPTWPNMAICSSNKYKDQFQNRIMIQQVQNSFSSIKDYEFPLSCCSTNNYSQAQMVEFTEKLTAGQAAVSRFGRLAEMAKHGNLLVK